MIKFSITYSEKNVNKTSLREIQTETSIETGVEISWKLQLKRWCLRAATENNDDVTAKNQQFAQKQKK